MTQKEGSYYLEYIGWKEAPGIYGREFTEPVIKELLARQRHHVELPKMTIKLNHKEIQISQTVIKKSGGKPEKTKYPPIATKDVTFVTPGLYPDNDVVACIFLGYNPYTKCAVHVHVYRFDSADSASLFVNHLSAIIDRPDFKERIIGIEKDLAEIGHVKIRSQFHRQDQNNSQRNSAGSDGMSYGSRSPLSSDSLSPKYPTAEEALKQRRDINIQKSKKPVEPDQKTKKIFSSLHEEFEYKVSLQEAPILLPPKDYDTIVRRHGKMDFREEIRASQSILGPNGVFSRVEAQPYTGAILEEDGTGSEKTQDSSDNSDKVYNGETNNNVSTKQRAIVRSSSDTFIQPQHPVSRQNSFPSSDRSNNSDEFFADGLYRGYKPKKHKRSLSKEDNSKQEDTTPMAMWSPSFSFGQEGMRTLHTHHEEDIHVDPLSRTAPAGSLPQFTSHQVASNEWYTITSRDSKEKQRVRRSHSHNHKSKQKVK